jgi:hypothetical protein
MITQSVQTRYYTAKGAELKKTNDEVFSFALRQSLIVNRYSPFFPTVFHGTRFKPRARREYNLPVNGIMLSKCIKNQEGMTPLVIPCQLVWRLICGNQVKEHGHIGWMIPLPFCFKLIIVHYIITGTIVS